jgi:AraC-like DNA-binding protein
MTVELHFIVPSADLAGYISLFYHFRTSRLRFDDIERAGLAQLRFRLAGANSTYDFCNGTHQKVGATHLVGPTTGPTRACLDGPIEVVGMGLTPAGWRALVRSDASAMVNRVIDCRDRFAGVDQAMTALRAAHTTAEKVCVAETFLRGITARTSGETIRFTEQVDAWLSDNPSPVLNELEAKTGLSRRQVERRCNALYGSPPKVLARKYRALRAAVALVHDGASIDDLLARGFYDQSHLIREIKHFTGSTPRQLRANPSMLAQLTIMERSALEGQVSPLISQT